MSTLHTSGWREELACFANGVVHCLGLNFMSSHNNMSSTGVNLCLRWVWNCNRWVQYSQDDWQNLLQTRATESARGSQAGIFKHVAAQCHGPIDAKTYHFLKASNLVRGCVQCCCNRRWQRRATSQEDSLKNRASMLSHACKKTCRRTTTQSNFFLAVIHWGLQCVCVCVCQVASPCAICLAPNKINVLFVASHQFETVPWEACDTN